MIASLKRAIPWCAGLGAYLAWRAGGLLRPRRPAAGTPAGGPVCVIQTNALGDVLMVTPLLCALTEALGAGAVDVVVRRHAAPLLEGLPGLGERILVEGHLQWRAPASILEFARTVRRLRARRYRAILDAARSMQSAWMTFLARPERGIGLALPRRLGPARVERLGYLYTDEVPADPQDHMIRQNLALLTPLGVTAPSARLRFSPGPGHREAARAWMVAQGIAPGTPYAVIHPGAKWPPKRWHPERFGLVAHRLQAEGLLVVLIGDARERHLLASVAVGTTPPPRILAGDLPLGALGALLEGARLFIGNDSGLLHLARAVGTPALAVFGPTLPERTGPLGDGARALVKPIPCRPCRLYFTRDRCERGHNYCMDLIEADEVVEAARALLAAVTASPGAAPGGP